MLLFLHFLSIPFYFMTNFIYPVTHRYSKKWFCHQLTLEEDAIFYIFSLKKHRALLMTVFIFGLTQRGYMNEWSFVSCTIFFLPSAYFLDVQIKISCFNIFFWLKLTFMLHPHPKQYPFPMALKKYSFIKENVIIGKENGSFNLAWWLLAERKFQIYPAAQPLKEKGNLNFSRPGRLVGR